MNISDKVIVGEVDMHVHACSRIGPVHLMNCRITCEFNLYRPLRENEVLTLIRDSFSDKTPEYIQVFGQCDMTGCIVTGTDADTVKLVVGSK